MQALADWLRTPDPVTFPYDEVIDTIRGAGKHRAPTNLLAQLDHARAALTDSDDAHLAMFLGTALDKWDSRFDNPSYLAFEQLPLPGTGPHTGCPRYAAQQRDRLLTLLVTDMLRFELAVADGTARWLPEIGPDPKLTVKRCRLGVRAVTPALARMGMLPAHLAAMDPMESARSVCALVADDTTPRERLVLATTMLPVSRVHDEYMFMRILQSYETVFALVGVQLRAAIGALGRGRGAAAASLVDAADSALREASLLFSIVATMRTEAFLTFREDTDGASAIQSRNYKAMESLCRHPDRSRLDSAAYESVPEIRDRILAGQSTLDQAAAAAVASGRLDRDTQDFLAAALDRFESRFQRWRTTHYRLAVRMLGERRGTGYTEGVPYLDHVRSVSIFGPRHPVRCPMAAGHA